jgi:uncharacterized protein YndB with AHSA1/START domain
MSVTDQAIVPVRKSVTVNASVEHAFAVFTNGFDTWWPRSHHIGTTPLQTAVIEGRIGGRCFGRSMDGTECQWGHVTVWEPPRRFAFAWMLDGEWKFNPDLAKASEVDVIFTALADGSTRVDLEHRHFERHGATGAQVRTGVDSPQGWGDLLRLYAATAAPSLSAPLPPALAPLALQLKYNTGLIKSVLADLTPAELWHRPGDRNNPILWLFGHIVATRAELAGVLGARLDTGWGEKFARGAKLADQTAYPPIQEIERVNRDVVEQLKAKFAVLTDAQLSGPPTDAHMPGVKTLADQIAGYTFHESYHVGQMAYVRKALGKPGVAG